MSPGPRMDHTQPLPRGARGSYAHLICSACRDRKIKCRLPIAQEEVRPSRSPRPRADACQRCRRLDLPCVVDQPRSKRQTGGRRHVEGRRAAGNNPSAPQDRAVGAVKPVLFEQYYVRSSDSTVATNGPPYQRKDGSDALEAFRAMLTSGNLMSKLLANEWSFGSSVSPTSAPERVPLTETISNGLAALLDESLVWHRFFLPFLPTLIDLRSSLASGSFVSPSTHLLFALLALCALDSPSSELYWHRGLRQRLQTFISYHGQVFLHDPPTHRHTVYVLHILITYKPTALIACQQSASAAVRGSTHVMLAYNIAKKCHFDSAASSLNDFAPGGGAVSGAEIVTKALDALLWCRTMMYDILIEGSIMKTLTEMESQLEVIDQILHMVRAALLRIPFPAPGVFCFHSVRCTCLEMRHYVRMRKARRDLVVLMTIIEDYGEVCESQSSEVLQMLSRSETRPATNNDFSVAAFLVPMEINQSRARLLHVGIFFAILAHITPSSSDDKIQPHEAVRVSKLVFDILRRPSGQELGTFLKRIVAVKDTIVRAVLADFADASKSLKLQNMPWLPPSRNSSKEILFQCWLIVDQNIAWLDEGYAVPPTIPGQLALLEQCAQSLETMSVPAGCSLDDAFANGCLYAASAKLIRCLHGILLTRTTCEPDSSTSTASFTAQSSLPEPKDTEGGCPHSGNLDFEQIFGEWSNWPYNSTSDILPLLQETVLP